MRVLVCGSRDLSDALFVRRHLDRHLQLRGPFSVVIHGDYRGADRLAKGWAIAHGIPHEPYPADWNTSGGRAGPIRNQRMVDEGKPDLVIAFPGGPGTADMIRRAAKAGIEVVKIAAEPLPPAP